MCKLYICRAALTYEATGKICYATQPILHTGLIRLQRKIHLKQESPRGILTGYSEPPHTHISQITYLYQLT